MSVVAQSKREVCEPNRWPTRRRTRETSPLFHRRLHAHRVLGDHRALATGSSHCLLMLRRQAHQNELLRHLHGLERRRKDAEKGTQVPERQTARDGSQVPLSQTAREEAQVPVRRTHLDEEEYQQKGDDIFDILEEKATAFERSGRDCTSGCKK